MADTGAPGSEGLWEASEERARHGSFRELFPAEELKLYAAGTVVFIVLALLTHDYVLNWIIGPLFITVWAWYVPVLLERWRARRAAP
jgi:hypothetical protein